MIKNIQRTRRRLLRRLKQIGVEYPYVVVGYKSGFEGDIFEVCLGEPGGYMTHQHTTLGAAVNSAWKDLERIAREGGES